MPVRIYDISKKLGLENKEVLAKAKELGIAAARVASSSLDKITAEYLEDQLKQAHPELNAQSPPTAAAPPSSPAPGETQTIVVSSVPGEAPAPVAEIQQPPVTATGTAVLESEASGLKEPMEESATEARPAPLIVTETLPEPHVEPAVKAPQPTPAPPPTPLGPKLGDKVGFIQLPPKPAIKPAE